MNYPQDIFLGARSVLTATYCHGEKKKRLQMHFDNEGRATLLCGGIDLKSQPTVFCGVYLASEYYSVEGKRHYAVCRGSCDINSHSNYHIQVK